MTTGADATSYEFRFDADGAPKPESALHDPGLAAAPILVAGENFGCGSSREVGVRALQEYGFRAVIARNFAEFRAKCIQEPPFACRH